MDTLLSLKVFRLVSELKSFAGAADRLDMSPAMVSKHVMHLEHRLDTRLLNRSSRHVSLTETGTLYWERVCQMLDALEEVETVVSKAAVIPDGILKLSAPVWMASPQFSRLLADYREQYPQVQFDIDLSGRHVNLVDEGFDLALRLTETPEEGLIARPLTKIQFHMVAAPSYLQHHGRPQSLIDLNGHDLLLYTHSPLGNPITLNAGQDEQIIQFKPVLKSINDTLLYHAAIEGMGVAYLPNFLVEKDLSAGRLELILPEKVSSEVTLLGVYSSRKYLSAKVSSFLDFVKESSPFNDGQ